MWFENLFGFRETSYSETKARFVVEGNRLRSLANGASFAIGEFSTPSLAELRARGQALAEPGRLRCTHESIGDVLELHARPENQGALFQVASQFNCLEFAAPDVLPEDGVSRYAHDRTQGPACSLAAAAATVYRNYFATVNDGEGQTRENQIDNLAGVAEALGTPGRFWQVKNGYTQATPEQLQALAEELPLHDREELLGALRIGLQRQVGVTFARRFEPPAGAEEPLVSQAFCSAISCNYSNVPLELWEPLATLVLDACYEATLWAAVIDAAEGRGSGKVWLTFIGGGVFGNKDSWIAGAIRRALTRLGNIDLDLRIAHYRTIDPRMRAAIGP